jgi:hypothetical protein
MLCLYFLQNYIFYINHKEICRYLLTMEYIITEKQLKLILSNEVQNQEIDEQSEAEPVSSTPTAGTSSTQSGGQGYPSVGKWESGLTRGPANQIGVTKWSDIVGSTLKRGKANQLK